MKKSIALSLALTLLASLSASAATRIVSDDHPAVQLFTDDSNYGYAYPASFEEPPIAAPVKYVPNEIIVKFRGNAAYTIGGQLKAKTSVRRLRLSNSLNELNRRHQVKTIKPLFKNFNK